MQDGRPKRSGFATGIGCLILAAVGIFQFISGFVGIYHAFGFWGIVIASVLSGILRTEIPFMIGTYICCTSIWRWHWLPALIATAPGLLFLISPVTDILVEFLGSRRHPHSPPPTAALCRSPKEEERCPIQQGQKAAQEGLPSLIESRWVQDVARRGSFSESIPDSKPRNKNESTMLALMLAGLLIAAAAVIFLGIHSAGRTREASVQHSITRKPPTTSTPITKAAQGRESTGYSSATPLDNQPSSLAQEHQSSDPVGMKTIIIGGTPINVPIPIGYKRILDAPSKIEDLESGIGDVHLSYEIIYQDKGIKNVLSIITMSDLDSKFIVTSQFAKFKELLTKDKRQDSDVFNETENSVCILYQGWTTQSGKKAYAYQTTTYLLVKGTLLFANLASLTDTPQDSLPSWIKHSALLWRDAILAANAK